MSGLIYLFRHGQSAAPPGLMVGRSDFELSPEGRRQAGLWGRILAEVNFTLAVASPLRRAIETAELILDGRPNRPPLQIDPHLREVSLGLWEGRSKDWVRHNHPQDWEARGRDLINHPPPGGESLADLAARVWPAFQSLARTAAGHRHSLVVAHQAVIRVILARLPGSWPANPLAIEVPPAGLSVLAVNADGQLPTDRPAAAPDPIRGLECRARLALP